MSSVNQKEIDNFESMASEWWDVDGPLKPLHKLNPTRISYIKRQICDHFDRDYEDFSAFEGLSILDIGCGGGLMCEPLTRLGGQVTGIDAGEKAIEIAKSHAADNNLDIKYLCETSDQHNEKYDVVLALEILEHVDHVDQFVQSVLKCTKPDGLVIFSTLNRTPKSFALGIVAAEYILRWLPRGTHDWKKFIKPSELARHVNANQFTPKDITGLTYNPLLDQFSLSQKDIDVNYFMAATNKKS
jgi:2-polyprenyl-6-hydroxyphenyl methylase/3-demethylubiquinone-9 3-methyltransferase